MSSNKIEFSEYKEQSFGLARSPVEHNWCHSEGGKSDINSSSNKWEIRWECEKLQQREKMS